jgi:hypothetical protein
MGETRIVFRLMPKGNSPYSFSFMPPSKWIRKQLPPHRDQRLGWISESHFENERVAFSVKWTRDCPLLGVPLFGRKSVVFNRPRLGKRQISNQTKHVGSWETKCELQSPVIPDSLILLLRARESLPWQTIWWIWNSERFVIENHKMQHN